MQNGGLINGLTGFLKGATTGVTTGYERAYAGGLKNVLRMNIDKKDMGLDTDVA